VTGGAKWFEAAARRLGPRIHDCATRRARSEDGVTGALLRHRRWATFGLALPVFVGGWLAALLGAQDYVPWLISPAVVVGLGVTLIAGVMLMRGGAVHARQVVLGVVLGLVGFALSLLLVFLAILAIWFRPGRAALPSAFSFSWAIYNRTEATVAVGPAMGLAPCTSTRVAADQTPGPGATSMPGVIDLSVGFRTPRGYSGVLSVVVASDGTHVYVGEIDPTSLPACQGQPRP
jgi:hypothetical protein